MLLSLGLLMQFSASAARSDAHAAPVAVANVEKQAIYRQVRITGSVTSPQVASLSLATSGLIADVLVEEGSRVEANSVLVALDDELAELQWQSAKAQHRQAQSAAKDAERRLQEARRLGPQRGIAETEIKALEAEVAEDQAALERAQTDAAYRKAILDRHQLRAPFAGVVSRKLAEQGEWINSGQGAIELVATEKLRLDFAVAEDYLTELQADTAVEFMVNALPSERLAGQVQTVVPVTETGARTFLLRILPQAPDVRLIPGMSATAILKIPTRRDGLVVPRDATLRQPNGRIVVWAVEPGEEGLIAAEHPVQVGEAFDGKVEIISGLSADARVVVRGNEALQTGQKVFITDRLSGGQ